MNHKERSIPCTVAILTRNSADVLRSPPSGVLKLNNLPLREEWLRRWLKTLS